MAFTVGRRPDGPDGIEHTLDRFRTVTTGTLGHLTDFGFADGLAAMTRPQRAVGRAFTVRMPNLDGTILHYAMNLVQPGEMIVIDTSGERRRATWGGVVAHAAFRAGVAGVVLDGPMTDWEEVVASGVPVWCRGLTSITARRLGLEGALQVPVSVGGAVVNPGDIVLADTDGVFFIPVEGAAELVEEMIAREAREPGIRARLDAGEKMADISGAREAIEKALAAS